MEEKCDGQQEESDFVENTLHRLKDTMIFCLIFASNFLFVLHTLPKCHIKNIQLQSICNVL